MSLKSRLCVSAGLFLFIASLIGAYPVFEERQIRKNAYNRYRIEPVTESAVDFEGQKIAIRDEFSYQPDKHDLIIDSRVSIFIDSADYSWPTTVKVRPYLLGTSRYLHYVFLCVLTDRYEGWKKFAIVQRIGGNRGNEMRFRVLFIKPDGMTEEEIFSFSDRALPLYRTVLIANVIPYPIGFYVDEQRLPSFFSPILYPIGSGAFGLILILFGIAAILRSHAKGKVV